MADNEMDWAELDEILTEMREYFEDRSDAEYFTDRASPGPNKELQLMGRCDEGIRLLARVYAARGMRPPQAHSPQDDTQKGIDP